MKRVLLSIVLCTLLVSLGAGSVWAAPPVSPHIVHVVRWGENLTSIAARYGTTIQAILHANGLPNANRIYAGQRLVIPTAAPPQAPPASCGQTYTVRYGDTLSGIALRFGVSMNAILRANRVVNPHRIYPGQVLSIPCGAQPAPPHVQPPQHVPPRPRPAPPDTCSYWYHVRRGDTLAKIAWRFGVSTWSIVRANNIANPNVIYVGQRLCIPGHAAPYDAPARPHAPVKPGCDHIYRPRPGSILSGPVQPLGTAYVDNFWYYKWEYRKDGLDNWHYITGEDEAVVDGRLGVFDTRTVPDGTYFLRLVVVDRTGNYPPPCEFRVNIDNHRY